MNTTIGLSKWQKLLNDIFMLPIKSMGYDYIGCEYVAQRHRPVIRVYIDKTQGVTIDNCGEVSRQLDAVLAAESPIQGQYLLEVSSPGIERVLFTTQQFEKVIGKEIVVRLHHLYQGKRKIIGILHAVKNGVIVVDANSQLFDIPLTIIAKAKLAVY